MSYGAVPTTDTGKHSGGGDTGEIEVSNVFPAPPSQKRGHICCFICCDVRRATIIVDVVAILILVMNIILLAKLKAEAAHDEFTDDTIEKEVTKLPAAWWYFEYVVSILLLCLTIRGAQIYNAKFVFVGFFIYCFGAVVALFTLNISGVLVNFAFSYPHYHLFNEIQRGTMTPTNYQQNEQYSCCCKNDKCSKISNIV
mmetsp:Transcript_22147/g.52064  ORF Transcript_22147/g.52064 Transcript_22147/m.52064 type:complete len:198 (+) Transcript_22147:154-747(+)